MGVRFAIVGPGRAGRALAAELQRAGWRLVGVLGRNPERTAEAAARLQPSDGPRLLTDGAAIFRAAEVVLLSTPDSVLAQVAEDLASRIPRAETRVTATGPVVLHLSGATPSTVLAPLRCVGCSVGALHPMQTLADADASVRHIAWGIEGEAAAVDFARKIVQLLEGAALVIEGDAKALYHAAAVVASNYLAVLIDVAAELLAGAGVPRQLGVQALLPLVRGAVENMARLGLPEALTGPIERGDVSTVKRHLEAFAAYDVRPQTAELYRRLGTEAVRLAVEKGSIDERAVQELEECLVGTNGSGTKGSNVRTEASDRR